MAVDIQRVVMAAVEAAVSDNNSTLKKKRKGLSTAQAVAIGAALMTAGRVAAKPGGRYVRNKLRERLGDGSEADADSDFDEDDEEYDSEEYAEAEDYDEAEVEEDEEPEAEVEEEQKPVAEEDEEEPEADADEDEAPDADADEGEDDSGRAPSTTHPRPPIFHRAGARGSKVRPAAQPPVQKQASTGSKRPKGPSKPAAPRRPRAPVGRD